MVWRKEHETNLFWVLKLATVVVCLIAGTAATTLAISQFTSRPRAAPLVVTACTPESYLPPPLIDGGPLAEPGPAQAECDRWFAGRDDSWSADEPIPVVGQVCNTSDRPVAYTVSVAFESVDTPGARIPVLEVPITYDPGCMPPYDFGFDFPLDSLTDDLEPGVSLGQWRIVGRADPVNIDRYLPYQWDATATVEIINPGERP